MSGVWQQAWTGCLAAAPRRACPACPPFCRLIPLARSHSAPPPSIDLQLKAEELQLLRPVATQGQRETKKQALKRALQMQRAGLELPSSSRLLQERDRPTAPQQSEEEGDGSEGESGSGSGSGSSSESDGEPAAPGEASEGRPPAKKQRTGGAPAAAPAAPAAKVASAAPPQQQAKQTQQEQQAAAAAKLRRQAAALRAAAVETKQQLGIEEGRDEEAGAAAAAAAAVRKSTLPAGPDGKPRVVVVQRRPEIEAVRCVGRGLGWTGVPTGDPWQRAAAATGGRQAAGGAVLLASGVPGCASQHGSSAGIALLHPRQGRPVSSAPLPWHASAPLP